MAWQIQDEIPTDGFSPYHLLASIEEGDELFTLEANEYMVQVYSDLEPIEGDAIVTICVDADNPSKFAHQLMRMTQTDTGNRLRTIDARLNIRST